MIVYLENPKGFPKRLSELVCEFSKERGCKVHIQK